MADKRRKCTISDDGMHVTPCEMLESQAEFGHPRGKKRGIFCWQYTSSETGLKTRTFFGVVSTESPNGMIFNCCPFCGERIDHPCLEPDERAELLVKSALSHAAGRDGEQCRAASVAPGEAEELAQWLDAKFKRHGEIEDKRAAELLRALSRGVPEGETVPKILMRAVKAANSAGAESLADDILSLMDTHWPTSDAAIAAQRKEGE